MNNKQVLVSARKQKND